MSRGLKLLAFYLHIVLQYIHSILYLLLLFGTEGLKCALLTYYFSLAGVFDQSE